VTFLEIQTAARAHHLDIFGVLRCTQQDGAPDDARVMLLLGPYEPGYWDHVTACAEWQDKQKDPIDRWSQRVITTLALQFDGIALFPFGGPPFQPFIQWALKSGQAWQSPVSLLVHARAGLMVSYRGALALPYEIDLPEPSISPCKKCEKPCLTACPSGALTGSGYDVPACHRYLDTSDGQSNLRHGCGVRRACPVSQSYGRVEAQSAYHMSIFHK